MFDVVFWTGPVGLFQVPGATVYDDPDPPVEIAVGCTGDGSSPPRCSDLAWSLRSGGGGSILDGMVERAGASPSEVRDVFVGAFSAGGGVVKRMLQNVEDAERVRAVLLSDATYSGAWADKSRRIPVVSRELVDFGVRVATGPGDQLWVATASPSPNKQWATGVEVLREYQRQIEERTGRQFERLGHFYGVEPAPDEAYQLGTVIFAYYPMEPLGHGHTEVAPEVWKRILWPWLDELREGPKPPGPEPPGPEPPGPLPVSPPSGDWMVRLVAVLGGAFAGWVALRLIMEKRS